MGDGEVKIQVSADSDLKGLDEAQRRIDEVNRKAEGQQNKTPPSTNRREGSMLATEANPRREVQKFRKLTDAERAAARESSGEQQTGTAATKKRIQELRKNAAAFESKGMVPAAGSARSEARSLERKMARHARERAVAEKAVTREMRKQQAMRKAGIASRGRIAGRVGQVGREVAAGGNAGGSLMNLGLRSGNPAAMAVTIAAALAAGLAGVFSKERDKDTMQGLKFDERRGADAHRQRRAAGIFGSSGELVSGALDAEVEIDKREKARAALEEKARQKWYAPSTWEWGGLRKNEGRRELEVNEEERVAAGIRKTSNIKQAQAKHMKEGGGLELDALRGRAKRTLEGSREAFVAEMGQQWLSKYKAALKSSGSENVAKEMADLTVQNKVRDRQAQAGAGLVGARSGGAEMAAAARWSMAAFPDVGAKIEALHATVQAQENPIKDQAK